jgi:hypothetical protein
MMQTAEPGHRYNLSASYGIRPSFTTGRRTLHQREMRSVVVVTIVENRFDRLGGI